MYDQRLRLSQVEAPVASSANQTWWTSGQFDLSYRMRGVTARAYIAIARGSPCVVPSVDAISPLLGIIILTGSL